MKGILNLMGEMIILSVVQVLLHLNETMVNKLINLEGKLSILLLLSAIPFNLQLMWSRLLRTSVMILVNSLPSSLL